MLHKVARDDQQSFRNNSDWLYIHPSQALVFSDQDRIWPDLVAAYNGAFRTLVFGPLPADHLVRQSMKRISDRVAQVAWQINRHEG